MAINCLNPGKNNAEARGNILTLDHFVVFPLYNLIIRQFLRVQNTTSTWVLKGWVSRTDQPQSNATAGWSRCPIKYRWFPGALVTPQFFCEPCLVCRETESSCTKEEEERKRTVRHGTWRFNGECGKKILDLAWSYLGFFEKDCWNQYTGWHIR